MARDRYVTARGLGRALADVVLDRLGCLRKGHDPVLTDAGRLCRRCLRVLA